MNASPRRTPTRSLPVRPRLHGLREQAKRLYKGFRAGNDEVVAEVNADYRDAVATAFRLSDAQLVLARSYGFASWPKLVSHVHSRFDVFKLLVEKGADIHAGNDSPLYAAIWQHAYGHWDYESVIRYLAQLGSQPRGMCDCARSGNLGLTKLLVELGADVNETDNIGFYFKRPPHSTGCTALDYCTGVAGDHPHPDIAEFLRRHGARHATELNVDEAKK